MRSFIPLLLISLLLLGCAAQPDTAPSASATVPAVTAEAPDPAPNILPSETVRDGITVYPLPFDSVLGIQAAGGHILVFSGDGISTTVTQFSGDPLQADVSMTMPNVVDPTRIHFSEHSMYWFDPQQSWIHVMSIPLQNSRSIDVPGDILGEPVLSADGMTLYYCTPTAIRGLDIATGISRVIKEASYADQTLTGLILEDTILCLTVSEGIGQKRTLFLSAEDGRLLGEASGEPILKTAGANFYTYQNGTTSLFASTSAAPRILLPRYLDSQRFLFPVSAHGVTAASTGARETTLDCYDLISGIRTASVPLPEALNIQSLWEDDHGTFWFSAFSPDRNGHALYHWDPSASAVEDPAAYAADYFVADAPDYEGLAACSLYAQELSSKYGLEILVYKDATAVAPWDYDLTHEYQSAILMRELEFLDRRLGSYPEGFLQTLRDGFSALKICIVRDAVGSADAGSLEAVDGIQFFDGTDAYIVLAAGKDTESALYHEMGHLMESVILTRSTAYDRWEALNPADFSYDMDYITNRSRDGSRWLRPGQEYFIDTYSMSFPKEDRARILEYAMLSGHGEKFASPHMQAKLAQICTGIREAFGLEDFEGPLLWEQYLYP